jgi:hypothetical protein
MLGDLGHEAVFARISLLICFFVFQLSGRCFVTTPSWVVQILSGPWHSIRPSCIFSTPPNLGTSLYESSRPLGENGPWGTGTKAGRADEVAEKDSGLRVRQMWFQTQV